LWGLGKNSLNDNLRLGRLTLPQWASVGVGGVVVWADALLAAGVRDPNMHIMAVCLPAVLVVAPILALFRGGIERYPQQVLRYGGRQARVYVVQATRQALTNARKGGRHAAIHVQASARRQR